MRERGHRLYAAMYDRMLGKLEREVLAERRERLITDVEGDVLEVGAGTGFNLPFYRTAGRVVLAEPDPAMRKRLAEKTRKAPAEVELSDAAAEALPFPDESFDVVVCTLVLCTVADPMRALTEIHRVLRQGGRLVVLEHVRGSGRLAVWQDRLTPLWSLTQAGCHPNRDTEAAIQRSGFTFERLDPFQELPGWLPVSPMLEAVALRTKSRSPTAEPRPAM